jgi:hypothetical protein
MSRYLKECINCGELYDADDERDDDGLCLECLEKSR